MKVLHFFKTYYPDSVGGVEQVIYQLCKGTTHLGINNEVLALSRHAQSEKILFEGHTIYQAQLSMQVASTGFSLTAFHKFSELASNADIVHYHYPWPFMDIVHFATRIKKPTVVTYHSDIIRQKMLLKLYEPLKHRFLSSVDYIVATSPNYLATSQVLDRYREKTVVIPIGLDKSTYPKLLPDLLLKWRTQVGERFFLFVGMIRYYKGLHILLDAVQGTDYPVVIVGSGPVETELKEHAARLRLTNVHFLGALPDADKVALLQLCYAVAFPSHLRSEAFGISLLEGAMYGKPMISSEIGTGTSYININGETGLVVPASNPAAFREAMHFLWNNPVIATEMGKRAEKRYWELFTADHMTTSYAKLYSKLLAKRSEENIHN
jgi:rhamnosyl/mannosyltransferase